MTSKTSKPEPFEAMAKRFKPDSEAYVIAGATKPDGETAVGFQGNEKQLRAMLQAITDVLNKFLNQH